ncbi:Ig-like domain-containing protein, partial [Methanococcus maripaludis]
MKNKIFMVLALAILCCSISTSYAAANIISPGGFGVVSSPVLIEFNSTTLPAGAWTYDLSIYNGIMGTTDTLTINAPSTIDEPNSINYNNLIEGFNYRIDLTVYDPAPTTVSQWITIDMHAPVISIETANLINSTDLIINVTANDAMLTPFITNISVVDAATGELIDSTIDPSSGSYQVTLTVPADGIYNVTANATDMAENSNVAEDSVTVDTNTPMVTINNPELDYNYSTNILNVTVDDVSVDTVIAEIDNGSVLENITLTESNGYFGNSIYEFAEGEYFVRIYANDSFGRINLTETLDFMVDWHAPAIIINNPVNGLYTNITNTTLNFTITDNVCESVICNISVNGNLVNSSEANTSQVLTYKLTLSEGKNNITITAIDDVGNVGETSAIVFIDSNNPSVVINNGIGPYNYNSSILNVTVTDTTPVTVIANITDQGMNITLNKSADGYFVNPDFEFIDGVHNVTIIATDAMGNVNSTETIQFMVDTTGPEFTIVSPINNTIYTVNHFMVNITAEDLCGVDTIKSDLDGWVVTLAEYPTYYYIGYNGMPDENYTIIFTAIDNLGNTAVKEIYVIVDTKPPEITINYPINGSYNTTDMFINATLTDLSGIKNTTVEINGINYTLNENGDYYALNKTLIEGDYVLKVYATDNNNNTNVSGIVAFTIDITYPEVTMETVNISDSKDLAVNVTAIDEKSELGTNVSVINALTGDLVDSTLNFTNGTYQVSLTVLDDGIYNVTATTMDAAGNVNKTEPVTVLVDTTNPKVVINNEFGPYNYNSSILSVNVTDFTPVTVIANITDQEGLIINLTLNETTGFFENSSFEFVQGQHNVTIIATDLVGNENATVNTSFMVDITNPEVTIETAGISASKDLTINLTATDALTGINTNISVVNASNGALIDSIVNITNGTYQVTLTVPSDGIYNVTADTLDMAGNVNVTELFTVIVDTTNPEVVINNGFGPYSHNSSILNVSVSDINLDSVLAEINGLENIT